MICYHPPPLPPTKHEPQPGWGWNLQPRYEPLLGIEPATLIKLLIKYMEHNRCSIKINCSYNADWVVLMVIMVMVMMEWNFSGCY